MKKRNRSPATVYLEEDILDHIKNNPNIKNISECFDLLYRKEFLNVEKKIKKLEWHLGEAEKYKEEIKVLKGKKKPNIISEEAAEWIKTEGMEMLERAEDKGVLKFFNNEFNEKLSLRQFKILLKEVEK